MNPPELAPRDQMTFATNNYRGIFRYSEQAMNSLCSVRHAQYSFLFIPSALDRQDFICDDSLIIQNGITDSKFNDYKL